MTTSRTYRTRDQWQTILDDFVASGLSAPQFCKQHNLPYGSFANWRQKLSVSTTTNATEPSPASFLDLSALAGASSENHWHITLKLGNGVELVLSQA